MSRRSRVVSFVEEWANSNGFSEIASDAEIENARCIRLFNQLGFRELSRSVLLVKTLRHQ